ncbi:MAG: hypothetical protein CFH44_00911 [Proteobacteria bacterium]|nr:MAG: hypothetical protein CFH44_00911 [Pseudomonadota bacterium]|tara:strand:- start:447 stop:794 length:348 start_codon:yes stop_codon:yes gene_type:complete
MPNTVCISKSDVLDCHGLPISKTIGGNLVLVQQEKGKKLKILCDSFNPIVNFLVEVKDLPKNLFLLETSKSIARKSIIRLCLDSFITNHVESKRLVYNYPYNKAMREGTVHQLRS